MKSLFLSNYETYYYGSDALIEGLILLVVFVGLLFFIIGLNKNKKNNVETTDTKSGNSVEESQKLNIKPTRNRVEKSPFNEKDNSQKKEYEKIIVFINKKTEEISPEAFKTSKMFYRKVLDGSIKDETHLKSMIDEYCKSIPKNKLEDISYKYSQVLLITNGIFSRWQKAGDVSEIKKLNVKGYSELETINELMNDIGSRLVKLSQAFKKTKSKLNPNQSVIPKFNEFSESEKKLVYHIALIRAMGEVAKADGVFDPNETAVFGHVIKKSKKESNLNYKNDEIQNLKEYKYIWGDDPDDFENNENLIIAIKNMRENDMNDLFEKLILMAISDSEFHSNEQIYIRDLYSSCKGVSKQKSTTWINSKIKEMGLK